MKTITLLETLVLAALAAGPAHAAPISLEGASITATYNGSAGVLGLDHDFAAEPGSNTTRLDPSDSGVEFMTGDYLFAFDFTKAGMLNIWINGTPAANGDYSFSFDFGNTLAAPITSFTLVDGTAVDGMPGLSVVNGHNIGLDLSRLTWSGDYASISAQIGTSDTDLPEPASTALLLAGAATLALARKCGANAGRA
jgi:hypothetical protein